MWGIAAIHCIRMAKHLQSPLIHSQVLIFHRIIFNHLNTFGRKVMLVSEIVFHQKNMKSTGLWVITMELFVIQMLIQILQSGGHSKRNIIQLSKQLWLAWHYLTFVTCVTFVTRVTMFRTLWFGVKRPEMCNIVTISSSTIRRRRITTVNASFQGFVSVWRKIHISVTSVTLPYQLMFEIIPWENKLDNILFLLQHS